MHEKRRSYHFAFFVLEVVCLLLGAASWANVYMSLEMLQDRVRELPPEMQAAFGVSHPALAASSAFRCYRWVASADSHRIS